MRLQTYRRWQREAAQALRGKPDDPNIQLGICDAVAAEALLLAGMLERGEITMKQLVREAMEAK